MIDSFRLGFSIPFTTFFLFVLFASGASDAQKLSPLEKLMPIPSGLTLPVEIHHGFRAGTTARGSVIVGVTTQAVPVGHDRYLPAGAEVVGRVMESKAADKRANRPAVFIIRFDSLRWHGQSVPIAMDAIAIANFTDVKDTLMPANGGADLGSGTTRQIGGDELNRSRGVGELNDSAMRRVGFADRSGVYADGTGDAGIPRALGAFSTTAEGLYGFDETAKLQSSGGDITITSSRKLLLRSGDDLLLKVLATP